MRTVEIGGFGDVVRVGVRCWERVGGGGRRGRGGEWEKKWRWSVSEKWVHAGG